jgi:hypothetical protein
MCGSNNVLVVSLVGTHLLCSFVMLFGCWTMSSQLLAKSSAREWISIIFLIGRGIKSVSYWIYTELTMLGTLRQIWPWQIIPEPDFLKSKLRLESWRVIKLPDVNQILAELFYAGYKTLCSEILTHRDVTWNKEELSLEFNTIEVTCMWESYLRQHVTTCEVWLKLAVGNVGRHDVTSFTGC